MHVYTCLTGSASCCLMLCAAGTYTCSHLSIRAPSGIFTGSAVNGVLVHVQGLLLPGPKSLGMPAVPMSSSQRKAGGTAQDKKAMSRSLELALSPLWQHTSLQPQCYITPW